MSIVQIRGHRRTYPLVCVATRRRADRLACSALSLFSSAGQPQGVRHVVVKGETLKLIAYNHGTNLDHMRVLNPGIDINYLLPGQEIVVPPEHKGHADAHDAHLQSGSRIGVFSRFKAQPEPDMLHTVQRGENLLAIASKYNMGLADIMALNPSIASSGPDSIKVGQQVVVTPGSTAHLETAPPVSLSKQLTSRENSPMIVAGSSRGGFGVAAPTAKPTLSSTVEVITQAAAWSKSGFLLVLVALPVLAGAWSLIWQLMTGFEGERTGSAQSASEADVRERGAPEKGGAAVASDSAGFQLVGMVAAVTTWLMISVRAVWEWLFGASQKATPSTKYKTLLRRAANGVLLPPSVDTVAETEVVQDPELMAAVDSLETIASAEGSMDFGADELVLDAGRFDRQPSASESNRVREALDALVDFVTAAPTLSACYGLSWKRVPLINSAVSEAAAAAVEEMLKTGSKPYAALVTCPRGAGADNPPALPAVAKLQEVLVVRTQSTPDHLPEHSNVLVLGAPVGSLYITPPGKPVSQYEHPIQYSVALDASIQNAVADLKSQSLRYKSVVVVCPEGSEELVMGRLQAAVPDMPIYTPGTTTLKADRAMRETTLLPDDRQRKYRDNSIPGSMLRLIGVTQQATFGGAYVASTLGQWMYGNAHIVLSKPPAAAAGTSSSLKS